ncbi:hypothetical protein Asal01_00144 [Fodinibius salicampi]
MQYDLIESCRKAVILMIGDSPTSNDEAETH